MILPLGDRVLVRQNTKEVEKSGIIVSDDVKSELVLPSGVVISVGDDVAKGVLSEGNEIFFNDYAGEKVIVDGETHLILRYHEIIAKRS